MGAVDGCRGGVPGASSRPTWPNRGRIMQYYSHKGLIFQLFSPLYVSDYYNIAPDTSTIARICRMLTGYRT